MESLKLFDADFKFMCIIWEHEPVNSTELTRLCQNKLGWKKPTTYSMIKKLSERDIMQNEKAIVTTFIKREQVLKYEINAFLEKYFDNSLSPFLTPVLQDRKLTETMQNSFKKL